MKRIVAVLLAGLALAAGVVVGALQRGDGDVGPSEGTAVAVAATEVGARNLPAKAVGPVRRPEPGFLAATASAGRVLLYPEAASRSPMFWLPNPTHEGMPLSFTVLDREGSRLEVRLPMRPNGSVAWIDAADVVTFAVPNHLTIDISDRMLTARNGSEVVMRAPVAVGSAATPTPEGEFYVDISVADPGGSYGAWMLSVAGFSDVLTSFGGGIGQIAIHGWSDESVIGQAVSNGCIRLPNAVIERLAPLAPVGTPVTIRA